MDERLEIVAYDPEWPDAPPNPRLQLMRVVRL
jgi:hypothetical protein